MAINCDTSLGGSSSFGALVLLLKGLELVPGIPGVALPRLCPLVLLHTLQAILIVQLAGCGVRKGIYTLTSRAAGLPKTDQLVVEQFECMGWGKESAH